MKPFKYPTDKQLIEIAILFNEGILEREKLTDMMAMCEFVLDRLYQNQDILKPSSKEDKEADAKLNLIQRDNISKILEKYSIWLTKQGYMDTDWKDEEPFAIDEYLKTIFS